VTSETCTGGHHIHKHILMYPSDGLFYVLKYMDVGGKGILAEVSAKLSRKRCFITDFSADDHENSRSLCRANVVEPVGNMSTQFGDCSQHCATYYQLLWLSWPVTHEC